MAVRKNETSKAPEAAKADISKSPDALVRERAAVRPGSLHKEII